MLNEKCHECSYKFRYRDLLKSIALCRKIIECPECKTKYKINAFSRVIGIAIIPMIIMRELRNRYELSESFLWLIFLAFIAVIFLVAPFTSTLSTEKQE